MFIFTFSVLHLLWLSIRYVLRPIRLILRLPSSPFFPSLPATKKKGRQSYPNVLNRTSGTFIRWEKKQGQSTGE